MTFDDVLVQIIDLLKRQGLVWIGATEKDGLSPGQWQVGGLQYPRPRQGRQGLHHTKLSQDGLGIGPRSVWWAAQAHRRVRQSD